METTFEEYCEQANEMLELTEDTVAYFCNEYGVSGQRAWLMLHALSEVKLTEFPNY